MVWLKSDGARHRGAGRAASEGVARRPWQHLSCDLTVGGWVGVSRFDSRVEGGYDRAVKAEGMQLAAEEARGSGVVLVLTPVDMRHLEGDPDS